MNEELQAAAEHLDVYGYCVLKDRMPRKTALALGRRCLKLHSDPRCQGLYHGRRLLSDLVRYAQPRRRGLDLRLPPGFRGPCAAFFGAALPRR